MKQILFISPSFFDYFKDITSEIVSAGYNVIWYNDRPSNSLLSKGLIRLNKNLQNRKIDMYFKKILDETKGRKLDYIIMILGQSFGPNHIRQLRSAHPESKFVYYVWDSVASFKHILLLSKEFDVTYSFDDLDCKTYGFKFLPLFYSNKVEDVKEKYEFSACLTIKPGKLDNFNKIINLIPPEKLNKSYMFLYLQSKLVYLYYKIRLKEFRGTKMKNFKYEHLTRQEANILSAESKVVIDCQMKNQVGLTMRTFETLHMCKKLVTTNPNIRNYEFYTPTNIMIIDSKTKEIPDSFLNTDFDKNFSLSDKYSVSSFVENLLK